MMLTQARENTVPNTASSQIAQLLQMMRFARNKKITKVNHG